MTRLRETLSRIRLPRRSREAEWQAWKAQYLEKEEHVAGELALRAHLRKQRKAEAELAGMVMSSRAQRIARA